MAACPLTLEGIRDRFLPECTFRGRQTKKFQYAVRATAALHGGTEPDLLDEIAWWQTDDFCQYALLAIVARPPCGSQSRSSARRARRSADDVRCGRKAWQCTRTRERLPWFGGWQGTSLPGSRAGKRADRPVVLARSGGGGAHTVELGARSRPRYGLVKVRILGVSSLREPGPCSVPGFM